MKNGREKGGFKKWWLAHQWSVVIFTAAAAFVLGFFGFAEHFSRAGEKRSFWDVFYLSLQLFVLESGSVPVSQNLMLNLARLLAPAVAAYTALMALFEIFSERLAALRLRRIKNHSVVFGLSQISFFLIASLAREGRRIVVVESDPNNTYLTASSETGAEVVIGNAEDPETLHKASVNFAERLYCLEPDDNVNAEIANNAGTFLSETPGRPVECVVNINDPFRCMKLMENEIRRSKNDRVRFEYFNLYSAYSSALIAGHGIFSGETAGTPAILIAGGGNMAESVITALARQWRSAKGAGAGRLRVTLTNDLENCGIDRLMFQYPALSDICEFEAARMAVDSNEFRKASFLGGGSGGKKFDMIFLCDADDSKNTDAAISLIGRVNELGIPTFVFFSHLPGLIKLYTRNDPEKYGRLVAFELADKSQAPELIKRGVRETLAMAIHIDYIEKLRAAGQTPSVPARWAALTEEMRDSNRSQADHIFVKLDAAGCTIAPLFEKAGDGFKFEKDEIEKLAVMEHERWNREKAANGWTYSKTRDNEKKTTPYLVPYGELPESVKQYDRDAVIRIPALLEIAGFKIVRKRA